MTRRLVSTAVAALAALAALPALAVPNAAAAPLPAGSTGILSGEGSLFAALPAPVNNSTTSSEAISADGRRVAFVSGSDGLVADDDDRVQNVYVKDRSSGEVILVSRASGGAGEPTRSACGDPAISDDGSRVAFTCEGPLEAADTNGAEDVYVRELATAKTTLASRVGVTGPVGDGPSRQPTLNADGRVVAFASEAGNLIGGDGSGGEKVFYRRELSGGGLVTDIASRRSAANGNAPVSGREPSISDDGYVIAFTNPYTPPAAVDPADTNQLSDVYVRNITGIMTVLASRKNGSGAVGNGASHAPALAGNGSAVAFTSEANQFDPAADSDTQPDVYRRSLTANITAPVNIHASTGNKGRISTAPSIDRSGEVVGFLSEATQLDPADTDPARDAYVRNMQTNALHVASRADGATGAVANAGAVAVAVSGDGTKVVSALRSGRITPDADPRRSSVVLRDISASRTFSVARPVGNAPFRNQGGGALGGALSADGRFAAFVSNAAGLGLPDSADNGVFVRDRVTGAVTLASRADGFEGAALDVYSVEPAISADGRRVAFAVEGAQAGVWVRDLAAGRTVLASRADGAGGAPGNDLAYEPALDADGSRVAFVSEATNLGDGDADGIPDVHVRDLAADRTILVSRATGANGSKGNARSDGGTDISADGQRVAFASDATNLGDGDTDGTRDVHLRDLSDGSTRLVSAQPGGAKGNDDSFSPSIDAAGIRVAFTTRATNLAGATLPQQKVLVADLAAGNLSLASRAGDGAPANADAYAGVISPDGGYVAFDSAASNLAPGTPAGVSQVWRHDLAAARTELVSQNNERYAAGEDISTGGACVSFISGQALFGPPGDYAQAYLRTFASDCGDSSGGGGGGGAGGGGAQGDGDAGRDTVSPVISRVRLSPERIPARHGRTTLSFRASEPALLSVRLDRVRSRGRARHAGTVTRRIRGGAGRVRLSARVGRRQLRPGRYRLTVSARDAAGNRSTAKRLTLRITRR